MQLDATRHGKLACSWLSYSKHGLMTMYCIPLSQNKFLSSYIKLILLSFAPVCCPCLVPPSHLTTQLGASLSQTQKWHWIKLFQYFLNFTLQLSAIYSKVQATSSLPLPMCICGKQCSLHAGWQQSKNAIGTPSFQDKESWEFSSLVPTHRVFLSFKTYHNKQKALSRHFIKILSTFSLN